MERQRSRKLVLGAALCSALAMPATAAVTGVVEWLNYDQPVDQSLTVGTMHGYGRVVGTHPGFRCALRVRRRSPRVFSGGEDGTVRMWDLFRTEPVDVVHIGRPVWAITTVVAEGQTLVVGAGDEVIGFELRQNP